MTIALDFDSLPPSTPIHALRVLIPTGFRIVCRPTPGNRPKVSRIDAKRRQEHGHG